MSQEKQVETKKPIKPKQFVFTLLIQVGLGLFQTQHVTLASARNQKGLQETDTSPA